jgi:uncharacterized protein
VRFEWDEKKRLATIAKHKIDFYDAVEIFGGPVLYLPGRSEVGVRQSAVAPLGPKMICVVFTKRGDKIRIITARIARRSERERYQNLFPRTDQGDEGPN